MIVSYKKAEGKSGSEAGLSGEICGTLSDVMYIIISISAWFVLVKAKPDVYKSYMNIFILRNELNILIYNYCPVGMLVWRITAWGRTLPPKA